MNSAQHSRTFSLLVWAWIFVSFYMFATQKSMLTSIGGFTLHITDLLFFLAALYCVPASFYRWRRSPEFILLLFYVLLVLSFMRGSLVAPAAAGVEFRG